MTKVSSENVLLDASGIEKVWKANPDIKLGKNQETISLADYQASIQSVSSLNGQVAELRHQLDGLLDRRDDAASLLSGYNTRALSAIRGIFGPDSPEYDQAGGTRTSRRKAPTRQPQVVAEAPKA